MGIPQGGNKAQQVPAPSLLQPLKTSVYTAGEISRVTTCKAAPLSAARGD